MKNLLLISVLLLGFQTFSQDNSDCDNLVMTTAEEVNAAEPCIEELSAYVLTRPMNDERPKNSKALRDILSWAMGTPNYSFTLNEPIGELFKGPNKRLLGVYLSCASYAALTGSSEIGKDGLELLVKYIKKKDNGVKQTKTIKKFLADWKAGTIDNYLAS